MNSTPRSPGTQGRVDATRNVTVSLFQQRVAQLFRADLGPDSCPGSKRGGCKLVFFNQQFGRLRTHQCRATRL